MKYFLILCCFGLAFSTVNDYFTGGTDWASPCTGSLATLQSPINIITSNLVVDSQLQFEANFKNNVYAPFGDVLTTFKDTVTAGNSTWYFDIFNASNYEKSYVLGYVPSNFHFHAPSEHWVNGIQYDLEMHLVHAFDPLSQPSLSNPEYSEAVISVLYKIDEDNGPNPWIESMNWANIPAANYGNEYLTLNFQTDFWSHVSSPFQFYQYQGSLTTPPCTQAVNWYILTQVQTLTFAQYLNIYTRFEGNSTFAGGRGNNRNLEALNGRIVKLGTSNNVLSSSSSGGGSPIPGRAVAAIVVGWTLFFITAVAFAVLIVKMHKSKSESHEKRYQPTLNSPSRDTEADVKSKKSLNDDRSEIPFPKQ